MFQGTSEPPAFVEGFHVAMRNVFREMEALESVLRFIEEGNEPPNTELIKQVIDRLEPVTIEQFVIEAAMLRITGNARTDIRWKTLKAAKKPWERHVAEVVAIAWLEWLTRQSARPRLLELRAQQKKMEKLSRRGGAIHHYTLLFWSEAILELDSGNMASAQRLYRRAIELGAQFGTESHPMISWTYAATFLKVRDGS
jgi:hypothetical protein